MNDLIWDDFKELPLGQKIDFFSKQDVFHVLFAEQFNRALLDELYYLTNVVRQISKDKSGRNFLASLLSDKRAMLYFIQPSTRTYLSFGSACHILGLETFDVRSSQISSELKGESFEDTIRTFSSYFDVIIMRYPKPFYTERGAFSLGSTSRPIPIINAGSGKDQHPTQALLDIYTLRRSFESEGEFANKNIVMVGDLKRGRTVRSLSSILTQFKNIQQVFVSPEDYRIEDDLRTFLQEKGVRFRETTNFNEAIKGADAIYMTRLQSEYEFEAGKVAPEYNIKDYELTKKHLKDLKPNSIILHPLPRRSEIDVEVDRDPRAMYWRQVRNGMWTRAGILCKIFNLEKAVLDYYKGL